MFGMLKDSNAIAAKMSLVIPNVLYVFCTDVFSFLGRNDRTVQKEYME